MVSRVTTRFRWVGMPRHSMLRLILAMFTILALGLGPALEAAQASGGWLQFKNGSNSRIYVAVLYRDEARCGTDGWTQRGWWIIQPGETVSTIQMSSNTHYYYYAETSDGHEWSSDALTSYVPNSEFTDCYGNVRSDLPGYHQVGMKLITVEDTDRGYIRCLWTTRSCSSGPSAETRSDNRAVPAPVGCIDHWYNPVDWFDLC